MPTPTENPEESEKEVPSSKAPCYVFHKPLNLAARSNLLMTMTSNCSRLMASGLIGETLHSCTFFERKPTNPFSSRIRNLEEEIKKHVKKVDELKVLA